MGRRSGTISAFGLRYGEAGVSRRVEGAGPEHSDHHTREENVMRIALLILGGALALAQEDHSQHQHAVAGFGTVDFPTSCNAAAQKWISRGAALLHSFGYEE